MKRHTANRIRPAARHPGSWLECLLLAAALVSAAEVCPAADGAATAIELPPVHRWEGELADIRASGDSAELVVPLNYKIGRIVSPSKPAGAGELFTLAADVKTFFAATLTQELYRCWLELEFLGGEKVLDTFPSPELIGTHEAEQPLAVTAMAPEGTTAVRAVLCAQNKQWSVVQNRATIRDLRLLRLDGPPGGEIQIEVLRGFPNQSGARDASIVLSGDWPDGTAVALSSSRGSIPPAVLLAAGRAELPLHFGPEEVGEAVITARVLETKAHRSIPDPQAARLTIDRVVADGIETPVLVQLTRDGAMLPGRYQMTVQGIFVTPPWSVDLAPGLWQLKVSRGPQFQAIETTLDAVSGQSINPGRMELRRRADLPRLSWYGGDADGDVYHGERVYTDVNAESAAHIGQAMGLDWLGVGSWSSGEFGGPRPRTWGEAREVMQEFSRPNFLFLWTDERPKGREGHACFVGLERPAGEPFGWGWTGAKRPLRNFEMLQVIRGSGAATFANHPLRWWMNASRFNTNMYSSLPFDLCAAGLVDGVNINDKPNGIHLWSMLLDHGYRVAATAGADFCLDRPGGPPPGLHRMYCYCPEGVSSTALAEAVRRQHTVVSTGPVLVADVDGLPPGSTLAPGKRHRIRVQAWARGDQSDPLKRLELWAHGKAIATKELSADAQAEETAFDWQPEGEWDWVSVRLVSQRGWAMTSAFYAAAEGAPKAGPVECELKLEITGVEKQQLAKAVIEIWDGVPTAVTSEKLSSVSYKTDQPLTVPAAATIVVRLPDGRKQETSVYDAAGIADLVERTASGAEQEQPLLDWQTYEEVLQRCRKATVRIAF